MQPQPLTFDEHDWQLLPSSRSASIAKFFLIDVAQPASCEQIFKAIKRDCKQLVLNNEESRFFTHQNKDTAFNDVADQLQQWRYFVKKLLQQSTLNRYALAHIQCLQHCLLQALRHAREQLTLDILQDIVKNNAIEKLIHQFEDTIQQSLRDKYSSDDPLNKDEHPNLASITQATCQQYLDALQERQHCLNQCQSLKQETIPDTIRQRFEAINLTINTLEQEQILLNLAYEQWRQDYLDRPSIMGFDRLFKTYNDVLLTLDHLLLHCRYLFTEDNIVKMTRAITQSKHHFTDFQRHLIHQALVPFMKKSAFQQNTAAELTHYSLWRINCILSATTQASLQHQCPNDAELYQLTKMFLQVLSPSKKTTMKRSALLKPLQQCINTFPLENLLDNQQNNQHELTKYTDLLIHVIHQKMLAFYEPFMIEDNTNSKDRIIYLENLVNHWRDIAKSAMNSSSNNPEVIQLKQENSRLLVIIEELFCIKHINKKNETQLDENSQNLNA